MPDRREPSTTVVSNIEAIHQVESIEKHGIEHVIVVELAQGTMTEGILNKLHNSGMTTYFLNGGNRFEHLVPKKIDGSYCSAATYRITRDMAAELAVDPEDDIRSIIGADKVEVLEKSIIHEVTFRTDYDGLKHDTPADLWRLGYCISEQRLYRKDDIEYVVLWKEVTYSRDGRTWTSAHQPSMDDLGWS